MIRSPGHWPFLPLLLLLLLGSTGLCLAQRNREPRPPPLSPAEAAREGQALVAELLAQGPEQGATNLGRVRIQDAEGREREFPIRFEVWLTPTNWTSSYQVPPSVGTSKTLRLDITHSYGQPNRYELIDTAGATNAIPEARHLAPAETMVPFAGSDFWIADLGLEFLHWPRQNVIRKEMRHSRFCKVLESINPSPAPGGYARVVSWIISEGPHGIVHADAYNLQGEIFKRFDPTNIEKIEGQYQLEEMEMRNLRSDSRTWIKFNLR